ncbi:MAG TPA: CBS domain-containing protein [Labilithrix sp.]|nr:CBS domain-containing protein [Labilithrix sp.]
MRPVRKDETGRVETVLERQSRTRRVEADCGCVPVVDDACRPVGMITDRDICMATYTQGKPPFAIPLSSVMGNTVVTCRADDSIATAEELMRRHRIRRLPVVDASGTIVGILSLNDIATHSQLTPARAEDELGGDAIAGTLAAICSREAAPAAVAH